MAGSDAQPGIMCSVRQPASQTCTTITLSVSTQHALHKAACQRSACHIHLECTRQSSDLALGSQHAQDVSL